MDGNTIKNADITNTDITRYESTIELASKNLDSVQNIYLVATCYRLLVNMINLLNITKN